MSIEIEKERCMFKIKPIALPALTISLLIASGSSFFGGYSTWAMILGGIGVILIAILIALLIRERIPRIYLDEKEVVGSFKGIYEKARENGGQILATHIASIKQTEDVDEALVILQGAKERVEWYRLVFMEDANAEERWIKNMLSISGPTLSCKVIYVPGNYLISNVIWKIVPRVNIMLYSQGNTHISLLGLGTLDVDDEEFQHPNFAIKSKSKKVQDVLRHYYDAAQANKVVREVGSSSNYPPDLSEQRLNADVQTIIARMMYVALDNQSIIDHVGIFGGAARIFLNVQRPSEQYHYEDVDFMVLVKKGEKEKVRDKIKKAFQDMSVKIVWGDDETYFYYYRESGVRTIDVEIKEQATKFYLKHQLLGRSIFRNYWPLFTRVGKTYRDLLPLPTGYESKNSRMLRALNDRKGLNELNDGLKKMGPNVDPRRIVNHAIKNFSWAIFNNYPEDSNSAFEYLRDEWNCYFENTSIEDFHTLKSTESKDDVHSCRHVAFQLLDDTIKYCEAQTGST